MFVPHGWWHLVVNLDEINIAITHNYVSGSNLSSVFKFLDDKRDQISGCRDRDESIKPENLHQEFVNALQKSHPELVKRALDDPNWNCRAWTAPGPYENRQKKNMDGAKHSKEPSTHLPTKPSVMSKAACEGGFSFSFI